MRDLFALNQEKSVLIPVLISIYVPLAAVSQHFQLRLARRALRRRSHLAELPVIASDIRHLVFDDQMMLRIHDSLDVVADGASFLATAGDGAGIRIGKRQLSVRLFSSVAP